MSEDPPREHCPTCDAGETSASTGTCPMLRADPLLGGYLRLISHGWRAIRWEGPCGANEIVVSGGMEMWCNSFVPGRSVPDDKAIPELQTDGDATDVSGQGARLRLQFLRSGAVEAVNQGCRVVKWVHPKHGTAELSLSGEWEISGVPRYRIIPTEQEDEVRP
jgi:hypothetical protein